jgi:hypothetical protein
MELIKNTAGLDPMEPDATLTGNGARNGAGIDPIITNATSVAARVSGPKPKGDGRDLGKRKPYDPAMRVLNHRAELPNVDGRNMMARRYREIARAVLVDHKGGEDVSEVHLQLIRRFAASAVLAEDIAAKLANGEEVDIAKHATLSSTMVRIAARIGITRIAKNVDPPSLDTYLEMKARARAAQQQEIIDAIDNEGDVNGAPDEVCT